MGARPMTIITNDPVGRESTDMPKELSRRADTFVSWHSAFPEPALRTAPRTFEDEKEAFLSMLPMLASRHPGEYVAISKGAIADHDRSRLQVVRRFFSRYTGTPVYVGFVGQRDVVRVPTPFFRR